MTPLKTEAFAALRRTLNSYHPLGDQTWAALQAACSYRELGRHELLCRAGEVPTSFSFVYRGLFRAFVLDEKGNEYNKAFFEEGRFPGAMTALLRGEPSRVTLEALEAAVVIDISFASFRRLLHRHHDLALFQIHYLEHHWLLDKDARETELVQEESTERYRRFLRDFPVLAGRLPQYHIASHLGITPTQLSRIRKKIAPTQPM